MILYCMTLLLFHQGYTLVPVFPVQLGEPATLTCVLPEEWLGLKSLYWYKQDAGDSLRVITSLRKNAKPKYGPGFSASRLKTEYHQKTTNLTILRTVKEDEGMYHCGTIDWNENTWSGIYLSIAGNSDRTVNYSVEQRSSVNDPVRIGDSVTLECSVLSSSENNNCTEDLNVFWFRPGSHQFYPEIIYTDDDCKKEDLRRCVYSLSKSVTSSDVGTYYCAVATCGEILFGNGTNLDLQGFSILIQSSTVLLPPSIILALSLIVVAVLIWYISNNKCVHCKAIANLQSHRGVLKQMQRGEEEWIYSAAIFTSIKANSREAREREKIYAAVKAFGLE